MLDLSTDACPCVFAYLPPFDTSDEMWWAMGSIRSCETRNGLVQHHIREALSSIKDAGVLRQVGYVNDRVVCGWNPVITLIAREILILCSYISSNTFFIFQFKYHIFHKYIYLQCFFLIHVSIDLHIYIHIWVMWIKMQMLQCAYRHTIHRLYVYIHVHVHIGRQPIFTYWVTGE